MPIGALAVAGGNFLLYVLLRSTHRWLAYLQLFLLFIFAFVVTDRSFSVFYLLMFIIAILITELNTNVKTEQQSTFSAGKFDNGSFPKTILFMSLGVVLYIFIAVISTRVGGNIVGTPDLALQTTDDISKLIKPTLQASLGIVENFFTFAVFEAVMVFGLAIPIIGRAINFTFIIPMLLVGFLMGVFHVSAYSVSLSLIIWATMAFSLFIATRYFFKDSLVADTAHYLNNLIVSASRNLALVV